MSGNRHGYRGYIGCRLVYGSRVPQHIQNLVIRDYTARQSMHFKLSAVEYAMDSSFLILRRVLSELDTLEGIIMYSMFMLPPAKKDRLEIYRNILEAGTELHAAVEGMVLRDAEDVAVWENVLVTRQITSSIKYNEVEKWLSSTS